MINVRQAIDVLEILSSNEDPIFVKSHETTPRDLWYDFVIDECSNAKSVRIRFFGKPRRRDGFARMMNGTLWDMVLDRIGLPHKAKLLTQPRGKQQ